MNNEQWIDYAAAACRDAGVEAGLIETITTWEQKFADNDTYRNNAVCRSGGGRCLKIYGPNSDRQFHLEQAALRTLEAHGGIPAPRLIAAGKRGEERPYLIMSEIPGISAEHCWDGLSRAEQLAVAREIGEISAAVHCLPLNDLATVEQRFGGRQEEFEKEQVKRISEIEATAGLSIPQRDDLLCFLLGEALTLVNETPRFNHYDLSHAHIFLLREGEKVRVSGFIDWGEPMIGPVEWDILYHWFWTFSGDRRAMRECLKAYYGDTRLPERFARRCLAALFYSSSMGLLWDHFAEDAGEIKSAVPETIEAFFPAEVFGPPD
jgi:aminoglycoside phosphotransferase (APT) family kinase protein